METTQIAVIGAGPAGLQAAMSIGRVHREAVVFDSGEYRNAPVTEMHNVAGFDGTAPAQFRATARGQLEPYTTVELRNESVAKVSQSSGGFLIESNSGTLTAQAVILATGMRDVLPDVPGLAEVWGQRADQCPFCHGHEYTGRRVGILGANEAGHYAEMLYPITTDLVALAHGQPVPDDVAAVLAEYQMPVVPQQVRRVERHREGLVLQLDEGDPVEVDGLFLLPGLVQRAPFAQQLGLTLQESGAVAVDEWQRTSVDGVFAAGDMAHLSAFPVPMASVVQSMASGQMAAMSAIRSVMAKTS